VIEVWSGQDAACSIVSQEARETNHAKFVSLCMRLLMLPGPGSALGNGESSVADRCRRKQSMKGAQGPTVPGHDRCRGETGISGIWTTALNDVTPP
jgi:hypothetical protein